MLNESDLDALDGVAFVTDPIGEILAVGATHWNAFALENNAPKLTGQWVINQNLFNFISGPNVRLQLKRSMQSISSGIDLRLVMQFRCDSPRHRRIMRQSISPIRSSGQCEGFLFQSVELRSEERPRVDLFDFSERERAVAYGSELPIVTMCSWCQRVQSQPQSREIWVNAEKLAEAEDCSNVRIAHNICESCYAVARPR